MLRTLLFCTSISLSVVSSAQVNITPITSTDAPAKDEQDFKQMGAPMPELEFLEFHDSLKNAAPTDAGAAKGTKKQRTQPVLEPMPATRIRNAKELNNDGNLFVMLFNPTCSHCEEVTLTMRNNMKLFKKSEVVMLANMVMKPYLPDFLQRFKLDNYPAMHLGLDKSGFIDKVFLYQALPQINIYDKERKLIRTYTGEVSIDSLRQYIQ